MVRVCLSSNLRVMTVEPNHPEQVTMDEEEKAEFHFDIEEVVEFEKPPPNDSNHLRALNINAKINGQPVSRVFVDRGSTLNLIPYRFYKKLGRCDEEIIPSNIQLSDFTGGVSEVKGIFIADLTVFTKTSKTSFYVVDADRSYNLLLG